MTGRFKHLDLEEIVSRCDPMRPLSARGRRYTATSTGQVDEAIIYTALALKSAWAINPSKKLRMQDIDVAQFGGNLASALKRLEKMKQVKVDFDNEGVVISPGSSWIETSRPA
ncbi:MAG: hypothetical protein ABFE01_01485 [Phycisphaerales bacterium]